MAAFGPKYVPANIPGNDQTQLLAIERQRKIADALMGDAMSPLQAPQTGGRIASPVSPLAALTKVAQAAAGAYSQKRADEKTAGLAQALRQRQSQALEEIARVRQQNAPGGITQPQQPIEQPPQGGPITKSFNQSPIMGESNQPMPAQPPEDGSVPPGMAVTEDPTGKQLYGHPEDVQNINRLRMGQPAVAPETGIIGQKPMAQNAAPGAQAGMPPESAAEFAARVRIAEQQRDLQPGSMMAMPEIQTQYQTLLEGEKGSRKLEQDKSLEQFKYALESGRLGQVIIDPATNKHIMLDKEGNRLGDLQTGSDPNKLMQPGPDGKPVVNEALQNAQIAQRKAGAPKVQQFNNTKDDFANERNLRNDFKSEPIYKAHAEVKSAYSQIQQGIKMASPAGDLAAATKIMKLLDPTSVVRESELGMAMAATGMLDRVSNFASNIVSGNKLTPKQRIDFQRLADELFKASETMYNQKSQEYRGIAKDYNLNADRVGGTSGWKVEEIK